MDKELFQVNITKENARDVFSLPYWFDKTESTRKYTSLGAYEKGVFDTLKALGIDANELEDFMHGDGITLQIEYDTE